MMQWIVIFVILVAPSSCSGRDYYKAAAVEYHPVTGSSPSETISKNLEIYRQYIKEASAQGVDIIVFPEYGLTTLVQEPKGYAIDLSKNSTTLQELSNLSRQFGLYVVVNVLEEFKENGSTLYYNTNLVYDRRGQILTKFRKINLFVEPKLTKGDKIVTFSTDFGVTFGIFTCMDILYRNPSQTVLENSKVTDVVFPTDWFSTMPFYISLSVQHGYFVANGVNFIAANYGQPNVGNGGTGIYLADGTSKIYVGTKNSTRMIVHDVKKISKKFKPSTCSPSVKLFVDDGEEEMTGFFTYKDFKAENYIFKSVDLSQKETRTTICYEKFCCNFNISIMQPANSDEVYKLMIYDGEVIYDQSPARIRVCGLLACANSTDSSCSARISGTTKFTEISVDTRVEENVGTFYRPITLVHGLRPLVQSNYCNAQGNGTSYIRLATVKPQQGVLVFGIFGRVE